MTLAAWLTIIVITVTLALLMTERTPPALAVLGGVVALLALGVLSPADALAGFSNPAPFSVAALYVVARAVEKTGAIQPFLRSTLEGVTSPRRALARLLLPVAGSSAFLNNTPIVAMITPQVSAWAQRTGQAPSRFLMPVSFAAILGGVMTAIGTSTNLITSGLMESHGMPPMEMFEISLVGGTVAASGVAYLVLFAPKLLPVRGTPGEALESAAREFVVEMEVIPNGALDGAQVEAGGLRSLQGVFLAEVRRERDVIAPARPDTVVRGGDVLVFVGRADHVLDLRNKPGLRSAEHKHAQAFHAAGHTYFDAVVGPSSPLAGSTLREAEFRSRYQAAVLGIHRSGVPLRAKLGAVRLHVGDMLLVLSDEGFRERWRDRSDFLLIAHRGGLAPASTRQAWLVGAVLGTVVLGNAMGLFEILQATMVGALILVATRVLTMSEARRAIDTDVIILIAASFGLGRALEVTGLATTVADGIMAPFDALGPSGPLLGLLIATIALTEMITNNAAVVLMFPVAMVVAEANGLDPRSAALALAIAASASFLTPIGYQTNTMVFGPGGYRFGDYIRLGLPLTILLVVVLIVGFPLL
ncbi:MAG TPA: SLC13 family permease [Candidatus Limnocylindrales bacterium]|nr:SLC13 family permease [Candidatus Limnocylindrales bacterium]